MNELQPDALQALGTVLKYFALWKCGRYLGLYWKERKERLKP